MKKFLAALYHGTKNKAQKTIKRSTRLRSRQAKASYMYTKAKQTRSKSRPRVLVYYIQVYRCPGGRVARWLEEISLFSDITPFIVMSSDSIPVRRGRGGGGPRATLSVFPQNESPSAIIAISSIAPRFLISPSVFPSGNTGGRRGNSLRKISSLLRGRERE